MNQFIARGPPKLQKIGWDFLGCLPHKRCRCHVCCGFLRVYPKKVTKDQETKNQRIGVQVYPVDD